MKLSFTLPLVLDLRPGTVRWRFVSERQLERDLLMSPKISSLRLLLRRASAKDNDFCCLASLCWSWFRITEAYILENLFDLKLTLVLQSKWMEGKDNSILGFRILEGFKICIDWAILNELVCLRLGTVPDGHHLRTGLGCVRMKRSLAVETSKKNAQTEKKNVLDRQGPFCRWWVGLGRAFPRLHECAIC